VAQISNSPWTRDAIQTLVLPCDVDRPVAVIEVSYFDRRSRFRTHGPLGCGLQYFYKRLTDGAGRVGDAQDRGERGSDIYGGDLTERSLSRRSRADKDDRHELVVPPGRAVSGGDR
jgi:hypothetical protein